MAGRYDNECRSLKVEMIKGEKKVLFTRKLNRFSLLEISDIDVLENNKYNHDSSGPNMENGPNSNAE